MATLSVLDLILAVTIIALAGISVVTGASLLPQSASATTDLMTNTTVREQGTEEETISTTNDNISNALLGSLFSFGENIEFDVNPINETYSAISYLGSRIIMPPNAPGIVINATETGNVTSNIQPNGLSIEQGQGFIMTEEDAAAEKEENATLTYVMLSRANSDGTGAGTGVAFFSTNSTGQLAFLDNMVAIAHVEFSPEGSIVRIWEWKGGTLPLESGAAAPPTTANQTTTITSALEEEE